jgi:hypothetical protein
MRETAMEVESKLQVKRSTVVFLTGVTLLCECLCEVSRRMRIKVYMRLEFKRSQENISEAIHTIYKPTLQQTNTLQNS